jgi:hypothetical protein
MLAFLLVGCMSENNIGTFKEDPGAGGQDIKVDPVQIDFGMLGVGEQSTSSFTVTNVGDEGTILKVDSIQIQDSNGSFTILTPEADLSKDLPTGDSMTVEVAFTPLGANNTAIARVYSDDPDEPKVDVNLMGSSSVPELQIDPDPLDLGQTYLGCYQENVVTLTNIGGDLLTLDSITEDGHAFSLLSTPSLPLDLLPGESTEVKVLFVPYEERAYTGGLIVRSNEPASPRESAHTGEGVYAPAVTDTFEVPYDPPTDILFFVDQSCSMDDDARNLANNFSSFIADLSNYTTDWHIMVVNDDDGCNNSGILTINTNGYESKFSDAVQRGGGVWTEAGLFVADKAIQNTDNGECNDGFIRPSALLHVILVSDEPEQSGDWAGHTTAIINKKGSASLVKISAIAGDVPGGCIGNGNSADAGTGYKDAVNYTSGLFLSICSTWSSNVSQLASASISIDTFELSQEAAESTIEVYVNGSKRNSGWSYDQNTNEVIFSSNIPSEGDTVEITYNPLVNCD